MTSPAFDHTRMNAEKYGNLDEPRLAAAFLCLVIDYMEYLRSAPEIREEWNKEMESQTAQEFVRLVDNDIGFNVVKIAVPEFQIPMPPSPHAAADQTSLMQFVLTKLAPRLPQPKTEPRPKLVRRREQVLRWEKSKASTEVLALADERGMQGKESSVQGSALHAELVEHLDMVKSVHDLVSQELGVEDETDQNCDDSLPEIR